MAAAMQRIQSPTSIYYSIQNLPSELREIIYKKFIEIKLKERTEIGWDLVHLDLLEKNAFLS